MGVSWMHLATIHCWWPNHPLLDFHKCQYRRNYEKIVTNGIWFTLYAAGNIVGANIFYANEAPKYRSAMIGLMTCYSGMIALGIGYWFLLKSRNYKRDKEQGVQTEEMKQEATRCGFEGLTDFENKGFRYAL